MCFFRRKKDKQPAIPVVTKSELIHFEQLTSEDDSNLTKLGNLIIEGLPLIINLDRLSVDGANKTIAFLSGIIYAIDGEISQIGDKIFLFAAKDVYDDGTVKKFLSQI